MGDGSRGWGNSNSGHSPPGGGGIVDPWVGLWGERWDLCMEGAGARLYLTFSPNTKNKNDLTTKKMTSFNKRTILFFILTQPSPFPPHFMTETDAGRPSPRTCGWGGAQDPARGSLASRRTEITWVICRERERDGAWRLRKERRESSLCLGSGGSIDDYGLVHVSSQASRNGRNEVKVRLWS